ncbi:hypothetical protein ACTHPH_03155 [Paenibacillus pasadenensis]|uniref:Uncharacterized protein n=1 Tax=Paenibacillus pasadenensis TaxID=217090 RepID=A0A2N5N779_9BACL|nr:MULTISPECIES: hypothetical protein [Paenibacillus]PLT46175.1 hypothetical protein B8V81_4606 [Paenibacillus pasadenensis]QGG56637.1 hypothetical protein GE073_14290 [Paenibacillus sp. B01]
MVGSWRINGWIAAGGALLTLLLNAGRNPWEVGGTRALAAAAAFWLLAYALRFLLTFTLPDPASAAAAEAGTPAAGSALDLEAAGSEDLEELLREGWRAPEGERAREDRGAPAPARDAAAFQPLSPPQLRATREEPSEQELLQAVRQWNSEDK